MFLELNSKRLHQSSGKVQESRCLRSRPGQKVKLGTFTGCSRVATTKKCSKKRDAHAKMLFFQSNYKPKGSYSFEHFKFHDFFHDLLKLFEELFELFELFSLLNLFRTFLVLGYFWTLNSSTFTNSGVHQNACRSRC